MLLAELVATSAAVAATRSRKAKVEALAALLKDATSDVGLVARYLSGSLRQRRTGVGWRSLTELPPPATDPSLSVAEVDAAFEAMSELSGAGSQTARTTLLTDLMGRATADEQRFLGGLITGELRQGALDSLMLDAIARAADVPLAAVRRAAMLSGSTPEVAQAALTGGEAALAELGFSLGTPVRPMLAASEKTVADALARLDGEVAVEAKLDGIRVQVHKNGDEVAVFTRSLDDITARVPELVEVARALPARSIVLDGEALQVDETGRPRPFQESASRAASRKGSSALSVFFFDVLHLDGTDTFDLPTRERQALLAQAVPSPLLVERLVTHDPAAAEQFSEHVLSQGHEGVVIKALDVPYEAGRRGSGWIKVKPVKTLDLVVLAVEWGSGRRRGTLSNIHLGARDGDGFVMLGKTFKGMTDAMLAWQTERFTELATSPLDGWVVQVRPEQVVEIAFDGLQRSTRYPGGLALRFARVVRYRDDKTAAEADTIETVRALA